MFTDYTQYNSKTGCYPETIPGSRFEVSGPEVRNTALLIAIAAVVSLVIGVSLVASQDVGSNLFWAGTADVLLGFTLLALAATDYHLSCKKHQNRMLHKCQTVDEYKALLETDVGVNYRFNWPGFVINNQKKSGDLYALTNIDIPRAIWMIDSKRYTGTCAGINLENKEMLQFANQSFVIYVRDAVLFSRYGNENVIFTGIENAWPSFNLILNYSIDHPKAIALKAKHSFELLYFDEDPMHTCRMGKYLSFEINLDFETGDAEVTWSSPHNEPPK